MVGLGTYHASLRLLDDLREKLATLATVAV